MQGPCQGHLGFWASVGWYGPRTSLSPPLQALPMSAPFRTCVSEQCSCTWRSSVPSRPSWLLYLIVHFLFLSVVPVCHGLIPVFVDVFDSSLPTRLAVGEHWPWLAWFLLRSSSLKQCLLLKLCNVSICYPFEDKYQEAYKLNFHTYELWNKPSDISHKQATKHRTSSTSKTSRSND